MNRNSYTQNNSHSEYGEGRLVLGHLKKTRGKRGVINIYPLIMTFSEIFQGPHMVDHSDLYLNKRTVCFGKEYDSTPPPHTPNL